MDPNQNQGIVSTPAVDSFVANYEINRKYVPALMKLQLYNTILIIDDSGSMQDVADSDSTSMETRWQEAIKSTKIIIEAHQALGLACHVFFLNRGFMLNVVAFDQLSPLFAAPPAGGTNTVGILKLVEQQYVNIDMGKTLMIHLLTDGHPTNAQGIEDTPNLINALMNRQFKSKTLFSIILCTDDEAIEDVYRRIENVKDINVDVTADYRGELREVQETRGRSYRFTYGDYMVKTLVGAYDKSIHQMDMPQGCCIVS